MYVCVCACVCPVLHVFCACEDRQKELIKTVEDNQVIEIVAIRNVNDEKVEEDGRGVITLS